MDFLRHTLVPLAVLACALAPLGVRAQTEGGESASPKASGPYRPVEVVISRDSADPDEVGKKPFDLVIVGGTPAGVAMAVRAAREGLSVLLVNHTVHLGGMLANGLGLWDFQYRGPRAPIFDELRANIIDYYRTTYGEGSPQLKMALSSRGRFEPKVAEYLIDRLVTAEKNISVLRSWIPTKVDRDRSLLKAVTLREFFGDRTVQVKAKIFADATYEGDLFALAKVPYRVGRESRKELDEDHAGQIYTAMTSAKVTDDSIVGRLDFLKYQKTQQIIPGGSGEGDRAIQAYNFRVTLTNHPDNRILPEKPANYDPQAFLPIKERWKVATGSLPNQKGDWNAPILIAGNWDYPEASWTERAEITARHRDFALGLLWFLQNDPSIPEEKRRAALEWGLAKDEFADNGNMPYEMYVREARRLVGRFVFSERDALVAQGLERAPIRADSIAITDWPLDSHECRLERVPGSVGDGKVLLTETTVPGQVPYRCLLPQGVDNLLVPMCLSATHIGWGTIRLEPTVMSIAESAGYAAALSVKNHIMPGQLDVDLLVRTVAEKGVLVSYFNDVDPQAPWAAAIQFLGTRGFFKTYFAQPEKAVTKATADQWLATLARLIAKDSAFNADEAARNLPPENDASGSVTVADFTAKLKSALKDSSGVDSNATALNLNPASELIRGQACQLVFALLEDS